MLPEVKLRDITIDDIDRIACWLEDERDYKARQFGDDRQAQQPVVTITGLPGSGAEVIGAGVARNARSRFIDEEIPKMMSRRFERSIGELEAFEASCRSIWRRMLRNFVASWEEYGVFDACYDGIFYWPKIDYSNPENYLTKREYLQGLKSVIRELALEGNVVLHGHGSHLCIPSNVQAIHVFIAAPEKLRQQTIASLHGLSMKNTRQWLKRADRDSLALCRNLFDSNLLDMGLYDIVLNLERLPFEVAVQALGDMVRAASRDVQEEKAAMLTL